MQASNWMRPRAPGCGFVTSIDFSQLTTPARRKLAQTSFIRPGTYLRPVHAANSCLNSGDNGPSLASASCCFFPRRLSLNRLPQTYRPPFAFALTLTAPRTPNPIPITVTLTLALTPVTTTKAMLIALVALALRSYANGREAVSRAIEATKGLCCGETMPSSGLGQGCGGGSGGAMGQAAAAGVLAVPLLHPVQVGGGGNVNRVVVLRSQLSLSLPCVRGRFAALDCSSAAGWGTPACSNWVKRFGYYPRYIYCIVNMVAMMSVFGVGYLCTERRQEIP